MLGATGVLIQFTTGFHFDQYVTNVAVYGEVFLLSSDWIGVDARVRFEIDRYR